MGTGIILGIIFLFCLITLFGCLVWGGVGLMIAGEWSLISIVRGLFLPIVMLSLLASIIAPQELFPEDEAMAQVLAWVGLIVITGLSIAVLTFFPGLPS